MEAPTIITRPKVDIDADLLADLETMVHEQGQVVVHCIYIGLGIELIRIWPTTYLYDLHSDHRSELVHHEKISQAPQWTLCAMGLNHFTLVFSGLPRSCQAFDLIEMCSSEGGAFEVKSIRRNEQDVYYVKI